MMTFLVRLFAGCPHDSTYRERRALDGVGVMHLVCNDCGHAAPAVQRTIEEHRLMLAAGAVRVPQAHPAFTAKRTLRRMA